MTYEFIIVETANNVATLTFDRPDALNALTPQLLQETERALGEISADPAIGVVVITGAGRAFSAGVDLKALQAEGLDLTRGDVGDDLNLSAQRVQQLLESMPQATIAKINGFCFTGGVELMLACDIVIAAAEAKFGDTHSKLGLRPTWGMTQRLPRRVGMMRAKELSFSARTIDGVEAARIGLVLEAVPRDQLDEFVDELSKAIAANSPGSIAAYKDLYHVADNAGQDDGLAYESGAKYDIPDVTDRMAGFLATLGGGKR